MGGKDRGRLRATSSGGDRFSRPPLRGPIGRRSGSRPQRSDRPERRPRHLHEFRRSARSCRAHRSRTSSRRRISGPRHVDRPRRGDAALASLGAEIPAITANRLEATKHAQPPRVAPSARGRGRDRTGGGRGAPLRHAARRPTDEPCRAVPARLPDGAGRPAPCARSDPPAPAPRTSWSSGSARKKSSTSRASVAGALMSRGPNRRARELEAPSRSRHRKPVGEPRGTPVTTERERPGRIGRVPDADVDAVHPGRTSPSLLGIPRRVVRRNDRLPSSGSIDVERFAAAVDVDAHRDHRRVDTIRSAKTCISPTRSPSAP